MVEKIETVLKWLRLRYANRTILSMVVTLYLLFVGIYIYHPALPASAHQLTDYISFWQGGRLMLEGNVAWIFDNALFKSLQEKTLHNSFEGIMPWVIFPTFMLIAAPLAKFAYIPSFFIFCIITLAAYSFVVFKTSRDKYVTLAVLALPSVLFCLFHGQTGLLSGAIIGGSLLLLPRYPFLSGVVIGLLIYKPQLGLLFPVAYIAAKQWRALMGAALSVFLCLALTYIFFGYEFWELYFSKNALTFEGLLEHQKSITRIQTILGFIRFSTGSSAAAFGLQFISSCAAIGGVFYIWRKNFSFEIKVVVLIIGIFFATPYLQLYDYTILGLAFIYFFQIGRKQTFSSGDKEWLFGAGLLQFFCFALPLGIPSVLIILWRLIPYLKKPKNSL